MSTEDAERLRAAGERRAEELGRMFDLHRPRLRRMLDIRMDARLRGRIDASDVIQEAWIEVSERIEDWLADPSMPFPLWVRFIAGQRLLAQARRHLGAKKRDVRRQRALEVGGVPEASAVALADQLIASGTAPPEGAARAEFRERFIEALELMEPLDREVLVLRHFEQMRNQDIARVLELSATSASNRYVRALRRLREILEDLGVAPTAVEHPPGEAP